MQKITGLENLPRSKLSIIIAPNGIPSATANYSATNPLLTAGKMGSDAYFNDRKVVYLYV